MVTDNDNDVVSTAVFLSGTATLTTANGLTATATISSAFKRGIRHNQVRF